MLNLLTSIEINLGTSSGEGVTTIQPSYSQVEVIFWYVAFVITVIVFIIVMRSSKNIKKKINKVLSGIKKIIKNVDDTIVNIGANKKMKKDIGNALLFHLNIIESYCLDLKDTTKLNEFDNIINIVDNCELTIKKLKSDEDGLTIEDLTQIREMLVSIENEFKRIKIVIK